MKRKLKMNEVLNKNEYELKINGIKETCKINVTLNLNLNLLLFPF